MPEDISITTATNNTLQSTPNTLSWRLCACANNINNQDDQIETEKKPFINIYIVAETGIFLTNTNAIYINMYASVYVRVCAHVSDCS